MPPLIHLLQCPPWVILPREKILLYLGWRKHVLRQLHRKVFRHILQLRRRGCDSCAGRRAIGRRNGGKIAGTLCEGGRANGRELFGAGLKDGRFLSKKIVNVLLLSRGFFAESSDES